MKEEFLYFIWQTKRFDHTHLSINGEPLTILDPGRRNTASGPDFFNGKIKIGNTTWAGNIEMHVKTSDWFFHGHDSDEAYQNVVLHVVFENDLSEKENAKLPPVLELKERVDPQLITRYESFQKAKGWVPCEKLLPNVDPAVIALTLQSMAVDRLEHKIERLEGYYDTFQGNLRRTLFVAFFAGMGFNHNKQPFEQLGKMIPSKLVNNHHTAKEELWPIAMGLSGLLSKAVEHPYFNQLKQHYKFLKHKYELQEMPFSVWKFGGMRPHNFPSLRLAQLCHLLTREEDIFDKPFLSQDSNQLLTFFETGLPKVWEVVYPLKKKGKPINPNLGKASRQLIMINVLAPILFFYGKKQGEDLFMEKALKLWQQLEAEHNHVIKGWKKRGLNPKNALESQALLQLKKGYCDAAQCLKCQIGNSVLK